MAIPPKQIKPPTSTRDADLFDKVAAQRFSTLCAPMGPTQAATVALTDARIFMAARAKSLNDQA